MEKLIFEKSRAGRVGFTLPEQDVHPNKGKFDIPDRFIRQSELPLPEVSENEVVRHFIRLSALNYNIDKGIYPLGSCTMKYNPKVNEVTSSYDGFLNLHPYTPAEYAQGALQLMYELGEELKEISGLSAVSLQPAAGSHGELTGILTFKAYHEDRGDTKRKKILIPDAAHGTNPASATISGFQIVNIKSNAEGRVDLEDLASHCGDDVAGFMLTNPNTVGIFEKNIRKIEELIHGCGGLMYMDGANLNALLGIVRPGDMGFDCVHINLHKTFSTPHGGGGPGAGPICVNDKLKPYLPIPIIEKDGNDYKLNCDKPKSIGKVHTFFGNFGVLVRAYTYIRMHGAEGLYNISKNAIINANYLFAKIKNEYVAPYDEHCMHEFIISGDKQKQHGVVTKDIAKRLLDYGFHAPTIYFPLIVHEAMLIEPTETETVESLDLLAETFIKIAHEAKEQPDLVINAPSTTPIKRVDDAHAARNLDINYFRKK